ncbi:MAG: hypothetical protein J0H49_08845 [Acidobacteria bacterium]|nr:hypothetical protein [Acidobacteriota bacterium]
MPSSFPVRFFLILCVLAGPAGAQFSSLAVDANAANVWFSTNLRLRTDPAASARLMYQATAAGVALMPGPQDEPVTRTRAEVNYVSDDADVVVWTVGHTGDNSVPVPGAIPQNSSSQTVIHRYSDGREWAFTGNVRLSRNGRWAWIDNTALNLQTGERFATTGTLASRDISDEGEAVILQSGHLGLLRPGGSLRPLPEEIPQSMFFLDRQAVTLVWSRSATRESGRAIMQTELSTGLTTALVEDCVVCDPLSLSGDGRSLLVYGRLSDGTPGVWALDTLSREHTNLHAGTSVAASLASSGQTACYSGSEGMIQCRDLQSGEVRTVVAKTPVTIAATTPKGTPIYYMVPGSLHTAQGRGLAGAVVAIDGHAAVVHSSTDTRITFQVPEESSPGTVTLTVDQADSPFRSASTEQMQAIFPRAILLSEILTEPSIDFLPFLENGTRGGLAGIFQPLRPGEVVWIHMTGLGSDPSILRWAWYDSANLSGLNLVPEEITKDEGWYTVKIRIPESIPTLSSPEIACVSPWDAKVGTRIKIPVELL